MLIRFRRTDDPPLEFLVPPSGGDGYPIRPRSFATSLGVHSLLILGLAAASNRRPSDRPVYDELVKPQAHTIRYYDLRRAIAEVSPARNVGKTRQPRASEQAPQTIIATAPNPKSAKQMVWLPNPKIQLPADVAMPNLIARLNTALPTLPAPPKPEPPKPQQEAPKAPQQNNSPTQENADAKRAPESPNESVRTPRQIKAFVPPPPSVKEPRLPLPTPVIDAPAPSVPSAMQSRLAEGAGTPSASSAPVVRLTAPPAPVANAGNDNVDLAVANLRPSEEVKALPSGDRPGQFSKAPETGPVANGGFNPSAAVVIPNLTVRDAKPLPEKKVDPALAQTKAVLYAERVRGVPLSTLSVPLRPANRTIPRAVDARFQGRNVYTMVVPIENLPEYAGDWILWFSDTQSKPGETPVMRAPVPFRKVAAPDPPSPNDRIGTRVQVSATLSKEGKLDGVTVLNRPPADLERAAVQDVSAWEFKPATRNGLAVDVEIVIEVPFRTPARLAQQRSQP